MKTKIVHLPLLLLTALAAVSFARADEPPAGPPPGPPGEHGGRPRLEHRLQQLDETLQLTASQKEQIKALVKSGDDTHAWRLRGTVLHKVALGVGARW